MAHTQDRPGTGQFTGALDVPLELPLAAGGSRALAYIIDSSLVVLIELVLVLLLLLFGAFEGLEPSGLLLTVAIVAIFFIEWCYFITAEALTGGQSLGKRILGLRVVQEDGGNVSLVASMIRNLVRPVDFFPTSYTIGVLSIFVSERNQRLGDLAAGTLVVLEPVARTGLQPTRFPDRFSPDDIRLIEAWFQRAGTLAHADRARLAADLCTWLDQAHPGFVSTPNEKGLSEAFGAEA